MHVEVEKVAGVFVRRLHRHERRPIHTQPHRVGDRLLIAITTSSSINVKARFIWTMNGFYKSARELT